MGSFIFSRSKNRKNHNAEATITVAMETIKILKAFVPFAPAQAALDSLCSLLAVAQMYLENEENISSVSERCQRVGYIIKTAAEDQTLEKDERMKKAVNHLSIVIQDTLKIMEKKRARSSVRKFLHVFGDAEEIVTLDMTLTQFINEFQLQVAIVSDKNVREILAWVKAQESQRTRSSTTRSTSPLLTPSRPAIFFGRDEVVKTCVDNLLSSKHVALIGTGGMGKSTIAKAVLNEKPITSQYNARLFITYDGISTSSMTYQVFLDRIAEVLCLPTSTSSSGILQDLQDLQALLVIDNAETFLEAPQSDATLIYRFLEEVGSYSATSLIITTRNTETIPTNLPWHRINVTGLDAKAAHEAFTAVYPMKPIDPGIAQMLSDLEHHPLSINILANAAVMNDWSAVALQKAWAEQKTNLLELAESDKNRSLRATIELSIAAFKDSTSILLILRAIAFLPLGIHEDNFSAMFPTIPNISLQVQALRRSSLIYRNGDRMTMLAPIRMYISDQYNHSLPYDSLLLSFIRSHYHSQLSVDAYDFVEREHGNIDHLMHFDITSSLYQSSPDIHILTLKKASVFLSCASAQTSLWPPLVSETKNSSFNAVDSLAPYISLCLNKLCWVDYEGNTEYQDCLLKLDFVETYCRDHAPLCDEQLATCLRLKGMILFTIGDLRHAAPALQEGSWISQSLNDLLGEALLNDSFADILLLQGKHNEAEDLLLHVCEYYKSHNDYENLMEHFFRRSYVAASRKNFRGALAFIEEAMELDEVYNGGRRHLYALTWKASCEGWAGDFKAALRTLEEATRVEIEFGMPLFTDYLEATRGKAYYEARTGRFDDARSSIAHAIELESEIGGNPGNTFISGCIDSFAGDIVDAISELRDIVDYNSGNDRRWTAIYHRTYAEMLLLNGKELKAEAQFKKTATCCHDAGVSPTCLYLNDFHWYSLPVEYDGWARFLSRTT